MSKTTGGRGFDPLPAHFWFIMKEKLFFKTPDEIKLKGVLSNPTNSKQKPIIIMCHGFASSKDSKTYTTLEEKLNDKSISTFRFDFFGHGDSEGKFEDITVTEAANDILNAIEFLKSKGYKKIGLMGSSFGGMASLLAASQRDDLFVLALKSPVSDQIGKLVVDMNDKRIEDWKEKGFIKHHKRRLNFFFYKDASSIDGYDYIRKIKMPTLILHGDKDKSVPLKQSIKSTMLLDNGKLEIINGADHRFSDKKDFDIVIEKIVGFILSHV